MKKKAKAKSKYSVAHIKVPRISKAKFNRMTNPQKRVAIAKDVITRLDAEVIVPKRGTYLLPTNPELDREFHEMKFDKYGYLSPSAKALEIRESSGQEMVENIKCMVCAKGALVVSWAANFNEVTVNDVWNSNAANIRGLKSIFPRRMRDRMETAFEEDKWPLRRIMENIIKNKGKFVYSEY
jgi:hypothetical protein